MLRRALTFMLLTCCAAQAVSGPHLMVTQGTLEGRASQGVESYLGVPFAAPPVGQWRWQPPQPPARWKGVRQAVKFGPQCIQGIEGRGSEDCLTLNIFRPAGVTHSPVMVWVHGGFFTGGDSRAFDGRVLARDYGVTVITLNYRVGLLGFLAASGVAEGNYGLMDVVQALRWTKQNAGALGIDAQNVTVFGQSAGAAALCSLLTAPEANGLFHKAILQSGSCLSGLFTEPADQGRTLGNVFTRPFQCADTFLSECLRGKPAAELLAPGFPGRTFADPVPSYPLFGTAFLPHDPRQAFRSGQFNRVPVLLGMNREEGRVFETFLPAFLRNRPFIYPLTLTALGLPEPQNVMRQYPAGSVPSRTLAQVVTDGVFACPAWEAAQLLSRHVPVFMYEFNDPSAPSKLPGQRENAVRGAYHGAELPYVFGTPVEEVAAPQQFTPAQWQLSRQMAAYWTAFARTGRPEVEGQAPWEAYQPQLPQVMTLQPGQNTMQRDFDQAHACTFWGRQQEHWAGTAQ